MRLHLILIAFFSLIIISCAGDPPVPEELVPFIPVEVVVQVPEPAEPEVQAAPPVPEVQPSPAPSNISADEFDPSSITEEEFETTLADIQRLIADLNRIIRANNYNSWLTYLSEDYRTRINSREFLEDIIAKYPVFRNRIHNARDYFTYVVVPSRANDRVDDIAFISHDKVTAYTVDSHGQRLILYNLEKFSNRWMIIQ
jgi:hypothetical protein